MKNVVKKINQFLGQHKFLKRLVIFLLILAIPLSIFLIFVKKYSVGFGDDASPLIFGYYYFQKHKFTWNYDYLGGRSFLSYLVWYFFQFIIREISSSDVFANLSLFFLLQFFIPFAGMFYFIRKIFKLKTLYALLGSLFYVYNPFHLLVWFTPIYSPILSFFPFTFTFYILALEQTLKKINLKQQIFFIGIISILLSLAINGISHISYANIYLFAFAFYYLYTLIKIIKRRAYRKLIPLHLIIIGIIFLTILLNLYWLYNDIALFLETAASIQEGMLRNFNAARMEYYEVIRLLGDWSFRSSAYNDYYNPYYHYFYTALGLFLTYALVVFIFLPILFIKKTSRLMFYYVYLFFILSFAAGVTSPLGSIFGYFYRRFNALTIFRSPNKVNLNIIFIYSIMISFSFKLIREKTKNKIFKIILLSLFFLSLFYTIWPTLAAYNLNKIKLNGVITSPYQKVPAYHYELKKDLENDEPLSRTLILPFYVYGTKQYWENGSIQGFPVPTSLVNKPTLAIQTTDPPAYKKFLSGESILNPEILKTLNIKNIVLLRDMDSRYYLYYGKKDPETKYFDYHFFEKILDSNGFIKQKDYFLFNDSYIDSLPNDSRSPSEIYQGINDLKGKYAISVYRVKDKNFLPIFYLPDHVSYATPQQAGDEEKNKRTIYLEEASCFSKQELEESAGNKEARIEYKEIAPYKYRIRIQGIRKSSLLVFSNLYHQDWKIYPTKPAMNNNNQKPVPAAFQNSSQNNNLSSGHFLESLFLQPLKEEYHLRANEYANAWLLNYDYLKKDFSEFIDIEKDGSMTAELIVEYRKQNIAYLLLFASLATFLAIIGFLVYYFISSHKHKPNHER